MSDVANICYLTAIELFSSLFSVGFEKLVKISGSNNGGNITNLIAVRCNMSCLQRFLSSFLMDFILSVTKESQDTFLINLISSTNSPLIENKMKLKFEKKNRQKLFSPLDYLNQALEICQESLSVMSSSINSTLQSSGANSILTVEMATNYMFQGNN